MCRSIRLIRAECWQCGLTGRSCSCPRPWTSSFSGVWRSAMTARDYPTIYETSTWLPMRGMPRYDLQMRARARQSAVNTSKLGWTLLLALAAVLPAGCGNPTGTVDGTVTYSGKPVTEGWVSFRDLPKGFVAAMELGPE